MFLLFFPMLLHLFFPLHLLSDFCTRLTNRLQLISSTSMFVYIFFFLILTFRDPVHLFFPSLSFFDAGLPSLTFWFFSSPSSSFPSRPLKGPVHFSPDTLEPEFYPSVGFSSIIPPKHLCWRLDSGRISSRSKSVTSLARTPLPPLLQHGFCPPVAPPPQPYPTPPPTFFRQSHGLPGSGLTPIRLSGLLALRRS